MSSHPKPLTIGVFDSGFGGLTVLRALLPLIPNAHYIYMGDTARLPYGSKSRETVARYAVESARFLLDHGADLLVIACNTATALALPELEQAMPIPVIGVVAPGAQAASQSRESAPPETGEPSTLVLATAATVSSHAYAEALAAVGLTAYEKACPLLVPLVEENWVDHPVTDEVIRIYLTEALASAPAAHTLVLGCTHYPLIEPAIHRVLTTLAHPLTIIDSAAATARTTAALVAARFPHTPATETHCTFYATDSVEKFQRIGSLFLNQSIAHVHLIDLGG